MKLFTEISKKACNENMCWKLYCTTCWATPLRQKFYNTTWLWKLKNLYNFSKKEQLLMSDSLSDIDVEELISESCFPDWLWHIGILMQMCSLIESEKHNLSNNLLPQFVKVLKDKRLDYFYFQNLIDTNSYLSINDLENFEHSYC